MGLLSHQHTYLIFPPLFQNPHISKKSISLDFPFFFYNFTPTYNNYYFMKYLILLVLISSCSSLGSDYSSFCGNNPCNYTKSSNIDPVLEIMSYEDSKVLKTSARIINSGYALIGDKVVNKIPSVSEIKRINKDITADRIVVYSLDEINEVYNLNSGKLISSNNKNNVAMFFFVKKDRMYE